MESCSKLRRRSFGSVLFKILAVGPCSAADSPYGCFLGDKRIFSDLPSDAPGLDAKRRFSVIRCKPFLNPHNAVGMPCCVPAGLTKYALNKCTTNSPPYPATSDDASPRLERVDVDRMDVDPHTGPIVFSAARGVLAIM